MSDNLLNSLRTKHATPATEEILSHDELMARIPARLNLQDWQAVAKLPKDGKVLPKHYQVYTVKQLLAELQRMGRHIGWFNGECCLFNGAFWKPILPDKVKRMLVKAALAFGMPDVDAELADFADKLYAQLTVAADPLEMPEAMGVVKVNFLNGTLTIKRTGETVMGDFDAADFLRYQLPYGFDPEAECPEFDKFLLRVMPDEGCRMVMAEWGGYTLVPHSFLNTEKVALYTGTGANGKSVVNEITRALLGKDNVSSYTLEGLTTKPDQRAGIANKLLNYASEISKKQDGTYLKMMASGESVDARYLYANSFNMTNYAKLQFNCNELPGGVEHNHGFRRRLLIIPFLVTIPDAEQDLRLAKKIIADELPGIFNWVLQGLIRLIASERFTESEVIKQQSADYQMDHDSVMQFIKSPFHGYSPSETNKVLLNDIFQEYKRYCDDNNLKCLIDSRKFKKRLVEMGIMGHESRSGAGVQMLATRNGAFI